MKRLRAWMLRLAGLFSGDRRERELAAEIESHLQMHIDDNLRAGMTPEQARREAILKLGGIDQAKQAYRERGTIPFIEQLLQDLRFARRQLVQNPGFACTAIFVLALGVGASTAIFSAINPILIEPLPYPLANRLTMIWEMQRDGAPLEPSFGTFRGLSERSRSFDVIAVMKPWQPTIVAQDQPERFEGQRVSASYFRALGISPVLGRDFEAFDDQFRGPNVVILSDAVWRRRFAGDRSIVGRQVRLDDNLYTVVGVMPSSFENVLAPSAELWAPLQYDKSLPADGREWGHHLQMVGRLRPGVSQAQARSELNVILHTWGQMYAKGYDSSGGVPDGMMVNSLQSDITLGVRPVLLAVLGAVILVLLIACVNVTNLLLARGAQRQGEFAMRAALGAGPGRLVRQLLTESLLLAILGCALGMIMARFGVRALVALSPPGLPRVHAIGLDGAVFVFGLGITTVVGIVVGLVPALQASRSDLHSGMQQSSRRTAGGRRWTRHALVVAEVSLAVVLLVTAGLLLRLIKQSQSSSLKLVVLLVTAGLLLRSLQHLFAVDPGFDAAHLLTMQVQESGHRFDSSTAGNLFFERALEAVRQVPGVVSAGFTSQLPLSGDQDAYGVQFERDHRSEGEAALRYAVTPGYLESMRIPLRRGRLLNERDTTSAPVVVLINESFAKRKFRDQDPIGQRVRMGPDVGHADRPWANIVGVVGDVKQESLAVGEDDAFYIPTTQWAWADNALRLVVRTRGDAAALAPSIRNAIWSVDKDQPVVEVATMDNLLAASEAERHFALILFEAFALVGLVLAATGIYGVLSGSVTERTREIGVRSALGASRRDILGLVFRQGMGLTAIGAVIGLSGAVIASRAVVALLFEVSRIDPITYLGVAAVLLGVSAAACWVPAWRAARVDPAITLRTE